MSAVTIPIEQPPTNAHKERHQTTNKQTP